MIKIEREMVLLLHRLMAEATGGSVGVRDMGLLDSALENELPFVRAIHDHLLNHSKPQCFIILSH